MHNGLKTHGLCEPKIDHYPNVSTWLKLLLLKNILRCYLVFCDVIWCLLVLVGSNLWFGIEYTEIDSIFANLYVFVYVKNVPEP